MRESEKKSFVVPEMPKTIEITLPKKIRHGEITILPSQTTYDSKDSHKNNEVKDGKIANIKRRQMRRIHPSGKQQRRK